MEILLVENVRKLGVRGDIVNVKDGYARNYLLPYRKALLVTSSNKQFIEQEKERNRKIQAKELADALSLAAKLEAISLTIAKRSGKDGALFGSVTNIEVANLLKNKGFELEKQSISVPHIKTVGNYNIDIRLYSAVHAKLDLEVTAIAVE